MRPADPSRGVTCPYGKEGSAWATGEHGGIDYGCPTGDPVYAMWAGTVTSNTWGSAYGTQLVIDHDHLPSGDPGLWAVYAHLSSKKVSSGQRVNAGQLIGYSGATGNVSGPHLHVEVQRAAHWKQGNYVDPAPWVNAQTGGSDVAEVWTNYSGKPGGTLKVNADDGYVRLDADTADPPFSGLEHHMLYVHCDLEWDSGTTLGDIRVKYEREGGDATGYQDYTVRRGREDFLITAMHWEAGESGIGGQWMINVGGGITRATITTRYQKAGSVKK